MGKVGYAWGCARSVPLTMYQAVSGGLGEGQLNPPWPASQRPPSRSAVPGGYLPTWVPTYAMDGRGRCNGSCGKWPGGRPPREEHCPSDDASPPKALINTLVGGTSGIRVSSSLVLLLHEPLFFSTTLKSSRFNRRRLSSTLIFTATSRPVAPVFDPHLSQSEASSRSRPLIYGRFRSSKRSPASQGPCGS